jgi:hypothetical protein
MILTLDVFMTELQEMGYGPMNKGGFPVEALKINFDVSCREDPEELIFTLVSPQDASALQQKSIHASILNIVYFFPESFDIKLLKEAKHLVNRINTAVLLPGFGVDEVNNKVYYRYSIPLGQRSRHIELLKNIINLVMDIINVYSGLFIQIAEGTPYQNVMEEALTDYLSGIGNTLNK